MTYTPMTNKEYEASVARMDEAARNCAYYLSEGHLDAALQHAATYKAESDKQNASSAAIEEARNKRA